MSNKILHFPKGFFWGAATSAHQIEGGLINDWTEWEKSPKRVKELKDKGLNPVDFQSGLACDSWHRFEEDIACLKKIKATAYRFSVDWSRVEPEEGRFDQAALNHYSQIVARLREEKIEPLVTLWHWPIPLWLRDQGGWTNKKIINNFKQYTERVVDALPTVKFWCTLNEPSVYAAKSYLTGDWPPQKKSPFKYLQAINNLIKSHKASFSIIKNYSSDSLVGVASHNVYLDAGNNIFYKLAKFFADWWWNDFFLKAIDDFQDYIGLNYYFHININHRPLGEGINKSDLGWDLSPEGFFQVIRQAKKYQKPIYILEHGLADKDDKYRDWYIKESLKNIYQLLEQGVDIRGYLHWSLLDNFEWADGFAPKFGLFSVDRQTLVRTARPSALEYAKICDSNQLEINN